ncbi:MAG: N-formylglutamate amidohydrolase [Phyllobacteriaceae bacterium]|nr:N-formylglutamate amidohydrolase [Phyllobacteriaceae bacterium]
MLVLPENEDACLFVPGKLSGGMLLIADHARNALPARYGALGLPGNELERHIAWDIGVEAVTRLLAAALDAPAVMASWSRLLIDPNRGEDDPTLIRAIYDRAVVPGNHPLADGEREARLARYYRPYHAKVSATIDQVRAASGRAPMIVSIHSFTPELQGRKRPWEIGVLWDRDDRVAKPLIAALAADHGHIVGDNEPYDGALRGDTMFRHCTVPGYPHALIEIRQDLIADAAGQREWADRLAPILARINRDPALHAIEYFGTRTGAGA